jgi:TPR repeat protein
MLGLMYYRGEEAERDCQKAANWFRTAALSVYEGALHEAASSDMEGFDTLLDFEQAYCWMLIAAKNGNKYAWHTRYEVYIKLSPEQRDRAKAVAERWLETRSADQAREEEARTQNDSHSTAASLQNIDICDAEEQYRLGLMYYEGEGPVQDFEKAAKWFHKAAAQGYVEAQLKLASMYSYSLGVTRDEAESFKWYKRAAEQGHVGAQCNVAMRYYHGNGVKKDHVAAAEWFHKAAEAGLADAQYELGLLYQDGEGVAQDYAAAVEWFGKAAEAGEANATCSLGLMYYRGEGVAQDYAAATEWFRRAALQAHSKKQPEPEVKDVEGWDTLLDFEQAYCWVLIAAAKDVRFANYIKQEALIELSQAQTARVQAVADRWLEANAPKEQKSEVKSYSPEEVRQLAEEGVAWAQLSMGDRYYYDLTFSGKEDYVKAEEWHRKAALQGHKIAQYKLGQSYYHGRGVPQDYREATQWFTRAAEQGYVDAQYRLASMYINGQDVEEDLAQGVEWLRKATLQGMAEAECLMGMLYQEGKGVEQSYVEAAKWYSKAAFRGFPPAQSKLGYLYLTGQGVEQDYEQAGEWIYEAAEEGYLDAQYQLGEILYQEGDRYNAYHWFRKTSEQGHPAGDYMDGLSYAGFLNIPPHPDQAYFWFALAEAKGWKEATVMKYETGRELSVEEIAEIEAKVEDWLKNHEYRKWYDL